MEFSTHQYSSSLLNAHRLAKPSDEVKAPEFRQKEENTFLVFIKPLSCLCGQMRYSKPLVLGTQFCCRVGCSKSNSVQMLSDFLSTPDVTDLRLSTAEGIKMQSSLTWTKQL